jgi:hypothetical protein
MTRMKIRNIAKLPISSSGFLAYVDNRGNMSDYLIHLSPNVTNSSPKALSDHQLKRFHLQYN